MSIPFSEKLTTSTSELPRLPGGDYSLLLVVLIGLEAIVSLLGLLVGMPLGGILSTLQRITFFAAVYAFLALALNLQWGHTGLLNIGVTGFMAIGVYTMGILAAPIDPGPTGVPGLGLPLWVAIPAGVTTAMIAGIIIAIPALRVGGDYFAILTLGIAEIIRLTLNSSSLESFTLLGTPLGTGGALGMPLPENPITALYYQDPSSPAAGTTPLGSFIFTVGDAHGIGASLITNSTYSLFLLISVGLLLGGMNRLVATPFGRVLRAIREDELVAKSLGKDTRRFKLIVFAVGCGLMGLGGILWQGSQGFVSPSSFGAQQTFYIVIALLIGGLGSNAGGVLGGILFAGVLFEGPLFLRRIIQAAFPLSTPNGTLLDALLALDPGGVLAYTLANIALLRFVFLGIVMAYLVKRHPTGVLGNRKEPAASVELTREAVLADTTRETQ